MSADQGAVMMIDLAVVSTVSVDWTVVVVMMAVPLAAVGVLILVTALVLGLNLIIGTVAAAVRTAEAIFGHPRSREDDRAGH